MKQAGKYQCNEPPAGSKHFTDTYPPIFVPIDAGDDSATDLLSTLESVANVQECGFAL